MEAHLYRSWDDSLYLTEQKDGTEGHLMSITGKTQLDELANWLNEAEIVEVFRALVGQPSKIEYYN